MTDGATEPAATEPAATEPAAAEPIAAEPAAAEPAVPTEAAVPAEGADPTVLSPSASESDPNSGGATGLTTDNDPDSFGADVLPKGAVRDRRLPIGGIPGLSQTDGHIASPTTPDTATSGAETSDAANTGISGDGTEGGLAQGLDADVPRQEPSPTTYEGPQPHPAALAHELPRQLAIANQKGGVGKTTTAVNLGAALAELEYRVLVVDLDPQGNATTGLGINARNLDASIYDVILHDVPIEDVIEPTTLRNLFVVPATIDLAGAEIELVPVFSRELRLRRALATVAQDFDYILIDCPPSLGLLTVNGLAAATEVVVPIQCEYYALEGLGQLLRNVALVQTNLNPELEVSTIILTMYDARTRLAEQVVEEVREHFGDRVCRNVVPRTVRLSEAPSFGQPIIVFDPSSRGAIAYRELAKEVSGGATQRVR
jgi:chromosome partitioning protein